MTTELLRGPGVAAAVAATKSVLLSFVSVQPFIARCRDSTADGAGAAAFSTQIGFVP